MVYIYNGSPTGLISKPSQKISGRSVYDNLRGFGYSISNSADVDANHYKGNWNEFRREVLPLLNLWVHRRYCCWGLQVWTCCNHTKQTYSHNIPIS